MPNSTLASPLTADLAYKRLAIVNVVFVGPVNAPAGRWVLIDAGIPGSAKTILAVTRQRFGATSTPSAIILTHGHFDHVSGLRSLEDAWGSDVPIYAHPLEFPYLTGARSYPAPDPTVGGGLMAVLSPLFPRGPIDLRNWLQPLPADGKVPGLPEWRWLPTPGHSAGHISLWRERDRALVAGDAFITTKQESAFAVLTQRPEIHGPPMYYTPDWDSAGESVDRLAELDPQLAITGHGPAMLGAGLRKGLQNLAIHFENLAIPKHGRYVHQEAA